MSDLTYSLSLLYSLFNKGDGKEVAKYKRILRSAAAAIAVLIGVIVLVFFGCYLYGKKSLSKNILPQEGIAEQTAYETMTYQGKEYVYRENLLNILCMGIDKEEQMAVRNDAENSVGQADAIFLVSLDLEKDEVRVLAIPRDTMVTLQMYDGNGYYMGSGIGQLTLQYAYADGMEKSANLMVSQVSSIMNQIPINEYAAINVYSLWNLNEAIGGIDMVMDEDYTMFHPEFKKGAVVHLSGNTLECYIRGRDIETAGSAYTRMHRLKQYMLAYFEKAKVELKEDVTLPFRVLDVLEKDMETSITADEIIYLVSEALSCSFSEENMYTLPGEQVRGLVYEEYYVDESALEALIVELFYEET